ncbi:MAG: BatD family protein [Woeseiaceae bacterium]|nr:BatD family protein [Woeseiaceae bacterium]
MIGRPILSIVAIACGVLGIALSTATDAAVIASVDRADIELNESFTLKVTVDTAIDQEPDASALEEDFYIGQRSQLSNTTIVNGQISRSRTWTYILMAKREGDLEIPPIVVGNERSAPVPISVRAPSNALPGEADIFVTTEVDHSDSFVQAQLLYTVKVYRAVATRQPRLSEPDIRGVEVLLEVAGEERSYESILSGKAYNVVERVYAIFPQESGQIQIAPARFEARVLRDGRITGRKIFESEAIEVTVNPIPPPPDDFPAAVWFPARDVTLSEDWSREPDTLPAGEPITRHITVTALGQLSTQIPVIDPEVADTVKVYPDKPDLRDTAEAAGIRATRKDQYAMIGISPGKVDLPELQLPWWDIEEAVWKVASLPGISLEILPSANAAVPPPVEIEDEPTPQTLPAASGTIVHSSFWRRVSEALLVLWVLTVFSWWWSRRPVKPEPKQPQPPPIYKQQAKILKDARKAARARDDAGVRSALLRWGRLEWPDNPPLNIGEFATRVAMPLSTQLDAMCRAAYGPRKESFDFESLAKSLRTINVLQEEKQHKPTDDLPPLMPA